MENQSSLPTVSVIIGSKDRRDELAKSVASVKEANYPSDKFEIIVVEEADTPQEIKGVKYVFIPRKNKVDYGYPRNLGVKSAQGEIIAFLDDDATAAKDWLKELVSGFKEEVMGVAGGVLVKDCNVIGYCETILGFTGGGLKRIIEAKGNIAPTSWLSTCNCAYRREMFEKVGLFKENTRFNGEDFDFARRVSSRYRCIFNPKAIVYHKPRGSLCKIFRWFTRRGICEVYLVKMGTNTFWGALWYNLTRSITLRFIGLSLILSWLGKNSLTIYSGLFIIYYLLIIFRYRFQWERFKNVKMLLLTPVVKLTMDLGMDWGRLIGPFILLKQIILERRLFKNRRILR